MMNDIKFRAWDKFHNVMFNFDIYNVPPYVGQTYLVGEKFERIYEIMQYTGLKDKSGTEIYEGDVLYVEQIGRIDPYIPHKKNVAVIYEGRDTAFVFDEEAGFVIGLYTTPSELEVIGNIYQHPELLGDSQ